MSNLKILNIPKNKYITDDGLKYIYGAMELDLDINRNITNSRLKYVPNLRKLYLDYGEKYNRK